MTDTPKATRWVVVALLLSAVAALVVVQVCSRSSPGALRPSAPSSAAAIPTSSPPPFAPKPVASPSLASAARLPAGCDALCDCCPSGRDCGARGCDASLARDERFVLRVDHAPANADASVRPNVTVCTPPQGDAAPRRCSNEPSFVVSVAELVGAGLEVALELPVATQSGVFRRPVVLRETIRIDEPTAASLCRGLSFELRELPIDKLALYLDPVGAPPFARCPAK